MKQVVKQIDNLGLKLETVGIEKGVGNIEGLRVSQELDFDINEYVNEDYRDEFLVNGINYFKQEFIKYGCNECYINFFIQYKIPSNKGLLELNDKEINILRDHIHKCRELARSNRPLAISYLKKIANEYIERFNH